MAIKEYMVVAPMGTTLKSGKLTLTAKQAARRRNALKHLLGDMYEVIAETQFKCGEKIGYDGKVNKMLLEEIGEVVKTEKKAPEPDKAVSETVESVDLDDLTKAELKKNLDERGVAYPKNANRAALIEKLEEDISKE